MKSIRSFLLPKSVLIYLTIGLFFSLAFAACNNTSDEGSIGSALATSSEKSGQTDENTPVSFSLSLSSLIQQFSPTSSKAERFTPDQILGSSFEDRQNVETSVQSRFLTTLGINVMDLDGAPVQGALVLANGEKIGITGSGTFGSPGFLRVHLEKGDYTIYSEYGGYSSEKTVTLSPLGITNLELVLDEPTAVNSQLQKPPAQLRKSPAQLRKSPAQLRKSPAQLRKSPAQLRKSPSLALSNSKVHVPWYELEDSSIRCLPGEDLTGCPPSEGAHEVGGWIVNKSSLLNLSKYPIRTSSYSKYFRNQRRFL